MLQTISTSDSYFFTDPNCWKFSEKTNPSGFDGGIHPGIIANLLHYFTAPGDVVIDPMAGGGTTGRVVAHYQYFRTTDEEFPHSGPRKVLMGDVNPQSKEIVKCDATTKLPWRQGSANMAILDPPYWDIAAGKYDTFGETIEQWRENVSAAIRNCGDCLRDGGHIAVIVDDRLRKDGYHPLSLYVQVAAVNAGLTPAATIYNPHPNFVCTMNAIEMSRAKKARLMVNEMKIISVFRKEAAMK